MNRHQRILLWLACSAIFFEAFDVSIVNLALPVIAADLHVPLATAQWVQTIYLLTFGGFQLLGGRLCDHYGSRGIFILGMAIFAGSSAVAYVSHQIAWLLVARSGQGIGAALAMPAGISLLSRHFEGDQQRHAFGIFGAFAAIGFASGVALGGVIATLLGWHWIFGVNVPVIAIVVVFAYRFIPAGDVHGDSKPNPWMAAWLTASLLLLGGAIHEGARLGWKALPLLLAAVGSGLALLRVDRRQAQPFFGKDVYTMREAYRGLTAFTLLGAGFLPFVFISTISISVYLQWGVLATGWVLVPYSIGSALVSRYLLPRLFARLGPAGVGIMAMASLLLATVLLAAGIWTRQPAYILIALALANSFAISIGYPAFTVLSLVGVLPARQGIAAGIQQTANTVGSGIGLSLISLCLDAEAATGTAMLVSCAVIAGVCVTGVIILVRKPKKSYLRTPK